MAREALAWLAREAPRRFSMPGPAPNPNARRRNDKSAWRTLPAMCELPAPEWPFTGRVSGAKADLWAALWLLPQAEMWHEMGAARIVARYVVLSLDAESADADPRVLTEVRQLEATLLLAPLALVRARCVVAVDVPREVELAAGVSNLDDYRDLDVG